MQLALWNGLVAALGVGGVFFAGVFCVVRRHRRFKRRRRAMLRRLEGGFQPQPTQAVNI